MMRNKTAQQWMVASFIRGRNDGITETKNVYIKEIRKIIEQLKYRCIKHTECDDVNHFCNRNTDVPCKYRMLNPNYEEAKKELG